MRELTGSKSVIAVLIGMYLCASLVAVPVPRFLADAFAFAEAGSAETACACGEASACSTSGSCCCAAKAHSIPTTLVSTDDERDGAELLTFGCTPPLKWFLAAVPVLAGSDAVKLALNRVEGERLAIPAEAALVSRWLDVQSPPPKRSV